MSVFLKTELSTSGMDTFFDYAWEKRLTEAFPYISFEHYVYKDNFYVRVARIGNRVTTAPFSDGGDVISKSGLELSLKGFREDLVTEFGNNSFLRVNEYFCPVTNVSGIQSPIADFKVNILKNQEMLASFRKTLRHVLEIPDPDKSSFERVKDESSKRFVYGLYRKNMQQSAGITLPWSVFDSLIQSQDNDLWVFKSDRIIQGASVFLNTKTTSYYYISAGSDMGKVNFSSHKLLWNAIKTYANEGKSSVFLGGTAVDSSLYTFKRGWRGEEYKVYSVGVNTHERARVSRLRSLWRFMPPSLLPVATKIVGRFVF